MIYIKLHNLSWNAKSSDIRKFFYGLGIPKGGVYIGADGDAFIAFNTDEDARLAMRMDNQPLCGEKVKLFLSSKAEMENVLKPKNNIDGQKNNPISSNLIEYDNLISKVKGDHSSPIFECSKQVFSSIMPQSTDYSHGFRQSEFSINKKPFDYRQRGPPGPSNSMFSKFDQDKYFADNISSTSQHKNLSSFPSPPRAARSPMKYGNESSENKIQSTSSAFKKFSYDVTKPPNKIPVVKTDNRIDQNPCFIKVSNFNPALGLNHLEHIFGAVGATFDSKNDLKMLEDSRGYHLGECIIKFQNSFFAERALSLDGKYFGSEKVKIVPYNVLKDSSGEYRSVIYDSRSKISDSFINEKGKYFENSEIPEKYPKYEKDNDVYNRKQTAEIYRKRTMSRSRSRSKNYRSRSRDYRSRSRDYRSRSKDYRSRSRNYRSRSREYRSRSRNYRSRSSDRSRSRSKEYYKKSRKITYKSGSKNFKGKLKGYNKSNDFYSRSDKLKNIYKEEYKPPENPMKLQSFEKQLIMLKSLPYVSISRADLYKSFPGMIIGNTYFETDEFSKVKGSIYIDFVKTTDFEKACKMKECYVMQKKVPIYPITEKDFNTKVKLHQQVLKCLRIPKYSTNIATPPSPTCLFYDKNKLCFIKIFNLNKGLKDVLKASSFFSSIEEFSTYSKTNDSNYVEIAFPSKYHANCFYDEFLGKTLFGITLNRINLIYSDSKNENRSTTKIEISNEKKENITKSYSSDTMCSSPQKEINDKVNESKEKMESTSLYETTNINILSDQNISCNSNCNIAINNDSIIMDAINEIISDIENKLQDNVKSNEISIIITNPEKLKNEKN